MRDFKRSSSCSRETKKIRKILNEEVKLGIHPSSGSETEEVDFQKDLHPLSHYMNNREEMIEQMFSIIKGDKLKKMLPPILKDVPLDELKADCLIHLLGMSRQRIMAILEGKEINSSSDSETHSDSSSPRRKAKPFVKPIVIKQEGCSDISDNSEEVILIDPDQELFENSSATSKATTKDEGKVKSKKRHKKDFQLKNRNLSVSQTISKKIQELDFQEADKSAVTLESGPDSGSNNEDNVPKEGKTLLEILELEMRARAIRALLHKNDTPEAEENINPPEKQQNPIEEEKPSTTEVKPVRKCRKKKRKNDDVIVITPKVVTIDLTDENYVCNVKKKPKELSINKKSENIPNDIKDDESKKVETTNKCETVDISKKSFRVTELEEGSTKVDKEKEQAIISASSESSHCSKQSELQDLQKARNEKSNWAQRWLESKEVKKVVSTSKICGNIRKRIKNAKWAKQNQAPMLEDKNKQGLNKNEVKSQEIEGRVDEYQLLSKSSNVSVSNANPSDTGNSEISLISNEGNSGGLIEAKGKEKNSSEQVQDVTSTKCESPKDNTACQESVLCESIKEILTGNSNSNSCFDDSTSHLTRPNALQNCDLDANKKASLSDLESDNPNNNREKYKYSPKSRDIQFNEEELESDSKNCLEEEVGDLELHPKIESLSGTIPSVESENICVNEPHNKRNFCLHSNATTNSGFNEEFDQSNNLDVKTGLSGIKLCDSKSNPSEVKSLCPSTELETLEINITDEDRDIDGIYNDKSELDCRNSGNKISIEFN